MEMPYHIYTYYIKVIVHQSIENFFTCSIFSFFECSHGMLLVDSIFLG